jgi:CDP-diglyceride synthetase
MFTIYFGLPAWIYIAMTVVLIGVSTSYYSYVLKNGFNDKKVISAMLLLISSFLLGKLIADWVHWFINMDTWLIVVLYVINTLTVLYNIVEEAEKDIIKEAQLQDAINKEAGNGDK